MGEVRTYRGLDILFLFVFAKVYIIFKLARPRRTKKAVGVVATTPLEVVDDVGDSIKAVDQEQLLQDGDTSLDAELEGSTAAAATNGETETEQNSKVEKQTSVAAAVADGADDAKAVVEVAADAQVVVDGADAAKPVADGEDGEKAAVSDAVKQEFKETEAVVDSSTVKEIAEAAGDDKTSIVKVVENTTDNPEVQAKDEAMDADEKVDVKEIKSPEMSTSVADESEKKSADQDTSSVDQEAMDVSSADAEAVSGEVEAPAEPELSELEKHWATVKEDPRNFSGWTQLIQFAETQCEMEDIRSVLGAFLDKYPYCYGYWKKYADLERNRGSLELCSAVFERGLAAIPLSVDLWLHFINHVREPPTTASSPPEPVQSSAETVQDSAETVQGSAETVQPSTETAQDSAENVPATEETVMDSTEAIQDSTETVQGSAETVQGSAETVQGSSETVQGSAETVESTPDVVLVAPEKIRDAFERATKHCGLEFRSDRLWEMYCSWEASEGDPYRVLALYNRILSVPTLSYRTHMENLEQLVGDRSPKELLPVDKLLAAQRAVLERMRAAHTASVAATAAQAKEGATNEVDTSAATAAADLLPPGCDELPPDAPLPFMPNPEEESAQLREYVLEPLRELHKSTERQVSLRWSYEELIRRPYFHVKPLERAQLKNWKDYLDYEQEQGDPERVRVLFERCLIACACYEEFWIKFARYLETMDPLDVEAVRSVYRRACWTHLPDKPSVHMLWATFEERHGDSSIAYDVVDRLSGRVELLEVAQRRVNLARRRGDLPLADQLYTDMLQRCANLEQSATIAVKFARFLHKVRDDRPRAERVLRDQLQQDANNQRLYLQLVDLGFQQAGPPDVPLVLEAFRMAIESTMGLRERLLFAHRRVEFLEEFGEDIVSLQAAQEEHLTLVRSMKAELKRRKQEFESAQSAGDVSAAAAVEQRTTDTGGATNGKRPAVTTHSQQYAHNGGASEKRVRLSTDSRNIPTITQTPTRPARLQTGMVASTSQPPPGYQQQQQTGYGHAVGPQGYYGGYQQQHHPNAPWMASHQQPHHPQQMGQYDYSQYAAGGHPYGQYQYPYQQ